MNNKVWAVINGAYGEVGFEVASYFARRGYSLVLLGRNKSKLQKAEGDLKNLLTNNQKTVSIEVELTSQESVSGVVALLHANNILPSVFVNSAGIVKRGTIYEVDREAWLETAQITVFSVIYLVTEITRIMKDNQVKGAVVLINGMLAAHPDASLVINSVTTAAIENFSRACAKELGKYGIRINVINPGVTRTPLYENAKKEISQRLNLDEDKVAAMMASRSALNKIAEPREIVAAVGFLCSEEAGHINGSSLAIDGGV